MMAMVTVPTHIVELSSGISYKIQVEGTSGQEGGIGRHGSPPHTTTSKLQLKYRTTITQNCQKLS